MARIKKNKKVDEIKEPVIETPEVEKEKPVVEEEVVEVTDNSIKKDYVVVLGTPSFYVIKLEDGSQKTIQGSNTYKRGDIVRL